MREENWKMTDYYDPVGLIDCAPMVIGDWRSQVGARRVVEVGDRLKTYEMSWDVIDLADAEARCLGIVARRAAHAGLIDWGLLTPFVWTRKMPIRCCGVRPGSDEAIWLAMRRVSAALLDVMAKGYELDIPEDVAADWKEVRELWVRVYQSSERWQHLDTVAKHVRRSPSTIDRWRRTRGSGIKTRGNGPNKQWDLWSVVDYANEMRSNQSKTQFQAIA